jgi:hypothetical protein
MKRLLAFLLLSLPAFAQVTTINGTDPVKNSRAVINTNFSNLQSQKQAVNYAADTGAADVYVVTLSPALASLADGSLVTFKASATNLTTTPTLNVNALGAKVIKKQQNVALAASDIVTNGMVAVRYNTDCACWQMQSNPGTAAAGGGSGTVTHTVGANTASGVMVGNGSADIKVTPCTIDSSGNLSCLTLTLTGAASGETDYVGVTSGNTVHLKVADSTAAGTLTLPGVTGTVAATTGTLTSGDCAQFDSSGRLTAAGAACGTGSGGSDGAWVAIPSCCSAGWTAAGSHDAPGYEKDRTNRVWLRGALVQGTTTSGTVMFTLPVGFRPAAINDIMAVQYTGGSGFGFCWISVQTNGDVQYLQGNGVAANGEVSIAGLSFSLN